LTTDVERRLAALITSTHINGIQCPLFSVSVSEANASGMVSIQITGFHIPESRQMFCSIERIVFRFRDVVAVPFLIAWAGFMNFFALVRCHD
jgi:hypothetical protein